MAASKCVQARRKKRVFCSKESPFPVPIESILLEEASRTRWFYYTAYLSGTNSVFVRHTGDMNFLYKMGFFGKGNLSRSQPDFSQRFRSARVPDPSDTDRIIQPRVISRRVYKTHLQWTGKTTGSDHSDEEERDSDFEQDQSEIRHNSRTESSDVIDSQNIDSKTVQDSEEEQVLVDSVSHKRTVHQTDWEDDQNDFWTEPDPKISKTEETWDTDPDGDFWGTSDLNRSKKEQEVATWEADDTGFWNSDEQTSAKSEIVKHDQTQKDQEQSGNALSTELDVNNSASVSSNCDSVISTRLPDCSTCSTSELKNNDQTCQPEDSHNKNDLESKLGYNDLDTDDDLDSVPLDSLCEKDDADYNTLVIDDSDTDCTRKKKPLKKKWRPVLKNDPYQVIEQLQLSFEETFFLSYGLGCLVVVDETKELLNLSSLWQRFCSSRQNFLPNYIAYHYYRSKGWVPKTGLKFGCDFIVYKEGPPFYHGSYSVVVKLVEEETLTENPEYNNRSLSWISLSGLNRITEHVAKELVLCYVIKPRTMTGEKMSPSCISQFKVQEVLVSRWVSSQERQEKAVEEFP